MTEFLPHETVPIRLNQLTYLHRLIKKSSFSSRPISFSTGAHKEETDQMSPHYSHMLWHHHFYHDSKSLDRNQ